MLHRMERAEDATDAPVFDTGKHGNFSATHWSIVLASGATDLARASTALEWLCRTYWFPIYAFIRRRGSDQHDAEDLTQGFFSDLLEKDTLKKVDRAKGKFRTFLLSALTNFLANEWDKSRTLKRGGQRQIISLDETVAEELYRTKLSKRSRRRSSSSDVGPVRLSNKSSCGSSKSTPRAAKPSCLRNWSPHSQAKRRREFMPSGRQHWE